MSAEEPYLPELHYHFRLPDCATFHLALVALTLDKSQLDETRPDAEHDLWSIRAEHLDDIRQVYIESIESLQHDVRIAVFGEMTYPASPAEDDGPFERKLANLAKDKDVYIVAGSYHDVRKKSGAYHNVCPIFTPDRPEPFLHYKQRSAEKVGEIVDVPRSPFVRVVCTPFANFGVILCLDADLTDTWIKIGGRNRKPTKHPRVHLIVAPTFDPRMAIVERAERQALVHGVALAYVNACKGEHGEQQEPFFQTGRGHKLEPISREGLCHTYEIIPDVLEPGITIAPVEK